MKKILILGTLLVIFVFYNCKNKETQPKAIDVPEITSTKVLEEIDTTIQVSPIKEVEINESEVVTKITTTTEVSKTITKPEKVENTTKTVTEPEVKKKTEVVTNIPVETKTETKTVGGRFIVPPLGARVGVFGAPWHVET